MNAVVKTQHGEVRAHKDALGWMRDTLSEHRRRYGAGIGRSYSPGSNTRGTGCLTWMCMQADLSRCLTCQILPAIETPFLGYRDIYGGLGSSRTSGVGAGRGMGSFSAVWSRACRGFVSSPKILAFLYQT
jgi:hypothetical protein